MKIIKINNLMLLLAIAGAFVSCLKKGDMNIDIEKTTSNIVELQFIENGSGSTINSGLQYFEGGALLYSAAHDTDTATYNVYLAGAAPLGSDLTVTLGVDPSKKLDNFAGDGIDYEIMPDSVYHFVSTAATITAGSRIAPMQIAFFPSKINPKKSYILPVVITDAGGQTISGNFATLYLHTIGNPLGGVYNVVGKRYNYTGSIGYTGGPFPPTSSTVTSPNPKVAAPQSTTVIKLDYANLGGSGYHYVITYDEANPSSIKVTGDFLSSVSNFAVIVKTYDPVLREIHIVSTYNNAADGSGNDRIIDETFTHR
jgi:hypothetical protein